MKSNNIINEMEKFTFGGVGKKTECTIIIVIIIIIYFLPHNYLAASPYIELSILHSSCITRKRYAHFSK